MKALVFVTPELSPFTNGGIGRVIHNIIYQMSQEDRNRTFIIGLDFTFSEFDLQKVLPGVRLLTLDSHHNKNGRLELPSWAFTNTSWHWKSMLVLNALRHLKAVGTQIEYVEFPDWGGLGFCTIQEKLLFNFLADCTLSIRLHSCTAVLLRHENSVPSLQTLGLIDLERKSIRDCDLLIGQLEEVAEETKNVLGIEANEWHSKLYIHSPPVLVDRALAYQSTEATSDQNILFTSKIQPFKAPDIFIRGVSGFMNSNPSYVGKAILCAHSFDKVYLDKIMKLVPKHLADRFIVKDNLIGSDREELISQSTVVVSSRFESYCLAAYEASLMGARLVINGGNPAFGESTPWIESKNCFKFDGTSYSLTNALSKNYQNNNQLNVVDVNQHIEPWGIPNNSRNTNNVDIFSSENITTTPLVSFVVCHYNMGRYLHETIENIFEQSYTNIEIVLIDDASTDGYSSDLVDGIAKSSPDKINVIRLAGNIGLAAARNIGIKHARGEYIVVLDADDFVHEDFAKVGVAALSSKIKYDFIVPQTGYFADLPDVPAHGGTVEFDDYAVFVGEAVASGVVDNRYSTATAFFRASVLNDNLYNHQLFMYEDWNLYRRLVADGKRSIVTNEIMFYYRRRSRSMVHAIRNVEAKQKDRIDTFRDRIAGSSFHHISLYGVAYLIAQNETAQLQSNKPQGGQISDANRLENLMQENVLLKDVIAESGSEFHSKRRWFKVGNVTSDFKYNIDYINKERADKSSIVKISRNEDLFEIIGWIADINQSFDARLCFLYLEKDGRVIFTGSLDRIMRYDVGEALKVENKYVFAFHGSYSPDRKIAVGNCDVFVSALGPQREKHKIKLCKVNFES